MPPSRCPECGARIKRGPNGWVPDHADPLAGPAAAILCPGSSSRKPR